MQKVYLISVSDSQSAARDRYDCGGNQALRVLIQQFTDCPDLLVYIQFHDTDYRSMCKVANKHQLTKVFIFRYQYSIVLQRQLE